MGTAKRHRISSQPVTNHFRPKDPLVDSLSEVRALTYDITTLLKTEAGRFARWGDLETAGQKRTQIQQLKGAANLLFKASGQELIL